MKGWFLAGLGVYFAAHAALRISLGGSLEIDEAEMLLLAQDWRLGYGPQLPLYNWAQVAVFTLTGPGTAGLAILKNVVLWLAYAALFAGLARVVPVAQAVAGTLALVLLPNVVWEFQRASTHSIALLATITLTVAAVLALLSGGRWRDYALFGLAMGLGGLAKANFWLVPVALLLASLRLPVPQRLRPGGLALAGGVAAAVVALPYLWVMQNRASSLGSTSKLYRADLGLPPFLEGGAEAVVGLVGGLLPVAIAVLLLWRAGRGQVAAGPDWPGRLLLRAGGLAAAASLAAIMLGGVTEVQARWLVPAMVLAGVGAMLLAARAAPARAQQRLMMAAAFVGVLTLAGMAELRVNGKTTGGIDYRPLAALTDSMAPVLVLADYHVGGNLKLLRPDLNILPFARADGGPVPQRPGAAVEGAVLILSSRGPKPAPEAAFAARGLPFPPDAVVWQTGQAPLPYLYAKEPRFLVQYTLLAPL